MRSISREYQADGSVVCRGGVDPTRTATYVVGGSQATSVAAFYALEPDDGTPEPASSYVASGLVLTVATLLASYPPSATYQGWYARVSDLFNNGAAGGVDEILRCRYDGTNYRWVPQRESFVGTSAQTSGTVTLSPLVTPPTLRLTGTLLGNTTVSPSATNAYLGQRYRVIMNGTLGIFAATITGLLGSNLTLLGNTVKDIEYGPTGWFASS